MRLAVVGSRAYPRLDLVAQYVAALPDGTVVVSGGAKGVDQVAASAARARGLEVAVHLPDWRTYGRAAGMVRNKELVRDADRVVAFWDGASRGTANTVDVARRAGEPGEGPRPAREGPAGGWGGGGGGEGGEGEQGGGGGAGGEAGRGARAGRGGAGVGMIAPDPVRWFHYCPELYRRLKAADPGTSACAAKVVEELALAEGGGAACSVCGEMVWGDAD